jgi:hypothetical protein
MRIFFAYRKRKLMGLSCQQVPRLCPQRVYQTRHEVLADVAQGGLARMTW